MTSTQKSVATVFVAVATVIAISVSLLPNANAAGPTPANQPEKLAVYYGDPAAVNGAAGNTASAIDTFNDYDLVVFGEGIEQAAHPYHANTQTVIDGIAATTRAFGYLDLCAQNPQSSLYRCSNFSQADIQSRVNAWSAMGAKGIFLDQAGCDYVVSRDRLNTAVDYIHAQGMSAFVNVWNVPDAFASGSVPSPYAGFADCNPNSTQTKLGPNDYELLESWGTVLSDWSENWAADPAATMRRGQQMMTYKAQYGTKGATINTVGYNNPPFDQAKMDWGWWLTSLFGLDAMGWGETWVYSSDTNSLPFHQRPDPGDIGISVGFPAVTTSGTISSRQTSTGAIHVDTGTHVGGFAASGGGGTSTTSSTTTTVPTTTSTTTTSTTTSSTTTSTVPTTTTTTRPITTTTMNKPTTTTTKKPTTTTTKKPTTTTTRKPTTTTVPATTTTTGPTNGWVQCSTDGATCAISGTQQVRYGSGQFWSKRTVSGSVACNAATFGDPNPGVVKTCQRNSVFGSVGPFTGMGFTQCAAEGGTCSFSGTKRVVFGNSGWYSVRTASNGVSCNAATFGDPLPGVSKVCWFG